MTPKVSLDFETRSRVDIRKCGAYKYGEDPSTEALIVAIKQWETGEPTPLLSWDIRKPHNEALELLWMAIEFKWEIHAFNSQFEWVILKYVLPRQLGFPVPDIDTLRCTAALCRSAGQPGSLGQSAATLKVPMQKSAIGHSLIRKFSIPAANGEFVNWDDGDKFTLAGEKVTTQEAFEKFVQYCEQDVRTEMAVAKALSSFELKGLPLESFLATSRLNDRGVPVDSVTLEKATSLYLAHEKSLTARYKEITGVSPSQNAASLKWMLGQGYEGLNLNKASREAHQNGEFLSTKAREALKIKGELSFAAIKKIPAMVNWVMSDGRIRGSFMWCGAQKTWRWTSKGVQWQNMKKPGKSLRPVIEAAYQDIRKGTTLKDLKESYGNPYEVIASLARYFVRFPDRNIYDLDYASVEAVILPTLIGAKRILEKFRKGEDIYVSTGHRLEEYLKTKYDVPFSIDRDTAKTVVLATQFQGGWHAVFTATGGKWERKWCEAAAAIVRKENPEFPAAWRLFQDTFVQALDVPRKWHKATKYVSFGFLPGKPFPRMLMRLPSGRSIVMPYPEKNPQTMIKVEYLKPGTDEVEGKEWKAIAGHFEDRDALDNYLSSGRNKLRDNQRLARWFSTWDLSFWGHTTGVNYGRVKTYGGDLLQSATQGTGADLLAEGVIEAEKQGFDPFFLVHDQCLTPADGRKDQFIKAMCKVPEWFKGFMLDADADEVRSYCKS